MSTNQIRTAILAAMKRADWTPNRLAVEVEGKVSRSQVYDYLNGKSDLGTDGADHLLRALGLAVKHGPPPQRR
jgi:hypothetical protein